jgi:hypothetical protein
MLSKKLAALAAISLVTASSAAVAQTAPSASPAVERAGAGMTGESDLERRGIGIYIIGAVVIGLIIWGAIELLDDGPSSP